MKPRLSNETTAAVTGNNGLNLIVGGSIVAEFTNTVRGGETVRMSIAKSGQITALFGTISSFVEIGAVFLNSDNAVTSNAGSITRNSLAIVALPTTAKVSAAYSFQNSGMISGQLGGVMFNPSSGSVKIVNTGSILGGTGFGIQRTAIRDFFETGAIIVENFGVIQGIAGSFDGGHLSDGGVSTLGGRLQPISLLNSGQLIGDVIMGLSADLYDGRLGTVMGAVFGGNGADTRRGG